MAAAAAEQPVPEAAAPDLDSDDEKVQLQRAAAEEEEEDFDAPPDGFAEGADDKEEELMLFEEMVRLTVKPGEQLRVLAGPPELTKALWGSLVPLRIVDVGRLVRGPGRGPVVRPAHQVVQLQSALRRRRCAGAVAARRALRGQLHIFRCHQVGRA